MRMTVPGTPLKPGTACRKTVVEGAAIVCSITGCIALHKTLNDYTAKVAAVRLCPVANNRGTLPVGQYQGNAVAPWRWGTNPNTNLNSGSYAINGWLYSQSAYNPSSTPPFDTMYFPKDTSFVAPTLTPVFMDGIWPDAWPMITDLPPADLSSGTDTASLGRICVARHPLERNATATPGQRLPSGINMGYADGHAARLPLQNIKTVCWHMKYLGNADPWATTGVISYP